MKLKGSHALVTGAGKRLGRAIAEALVLKGAHLSAHYFTAEKETRALVDWANQKNVKAAAYQADLRSQNQIKNCVTSALSDHGPVDILINCASIFYPKTALETTADDWSTFLDTNLLGQFYFAQAVGKNMLSAKKGTIINFVDVAGTVGYKNYTPYATSKGALLLMTKNLAKEWAPTVRVNSISPGPVLEPENYSEEQKQKSVARTVLKRWGTPNDVVNGVIFLIENDYITGFDLKIDGGRSIL